MKSFAPLLAAVSFLASALNASELDNSIGSIDLIRAQKTSNKLNVTFSSTRNLLSAKVNRKIAANPQCAPYDLKTSVNVPSITYCSKEGNIFVLIPNSECGSQIDNSIAQCTDEIDGKGRPWTVTSFHFEREGRLPSNIVINATYSGNQLNLNADINYPLSKEKIEAQKYSD